MAFLADMKFFRLASKQVTNSFVRYLSSKPTFTYSRHVTMEDVQNFAEVTGDLNPIHTKMGANSIVHGAFLVGLVSAAIGTRCPGEGTIVLSQEVQFMKPCYVNSNVLINVKVVEDRKISTISFNCRNVETSEVYLEGIAKVRKSISGRNYQKRHHCLASRHACGFR